MWEVLVTPEDHKLWAIVSPIHTDCQIVASSNGERPHQALGYKTSDTVYQSESGGGAMIVNKFSEEEEESRVRLTAIPGQRRSVADEVMCIT